MSWSSRKVLVTGAGGFIGSHLCEALVHGGAEVTAFVRYTSQGGVGLLQLLPPDVRSALRVVAGDLRDPHALYAALSGQSIVFHLAALIGIPYSYVHPTEVAEVNVLGTVNVLNAARANDVDLVVHTSTSETYGTAQTVPISEQHPLSPQSPYSASKIGADALAHSYWCSFGLSVATVRPFNTYGPRQSGRAVIPTIVSQALRGDSIKLGSLTPTRDFTYVSDTVAAFLKTAACKEAVGEVFNAGNGKEISIGELAETIRGRVGREIPIVTEESRTRPDKSEVLRLVCDAAKLRRVTGWRPEVMLEEGIDRVIEFLRHNPDWTSPDRYEV